MDNAIRFCELMLNELAYLSGVSLKYDGKAQRQEQPPGQCWHIVSPPDAWDIWQCEPGHLRFAQAGVFLHDFELKWPLTEVADVLRLRWGNAMRSMHEGLWREIECVEDAQELVVANG